MDDNSNQKTRLDRLLAAALEHASEQATALAADDSSHIPPPLRDMLAADERDLLKVVREECGEWTRDRKWAALLALSRENPFRSERKLEHLATLSTLPHQERIVIQMALRLLEVSTIDNEEAAARFAEATAANIVIGHAEQAHPDNHARRIELQDRIFMDSGGDRDAQDTVLSGLYELIAAPGDESASKDDKPLAVKVRAYVNRREKEDRHRSGAIRVDDETLGDPSMSDALLLAIERERQETMMTELFAIATSDAEKQVLHSWAIDGTPFEQAARDQRIAPNKARALKIRFDKKFPKG